MEAYSDIPVESAEERAKKVRLEFLASHKKPQSLHEDMQSRTEANKQNETARIAGSVASQATGVNRT